MIMCSVFQIQMSNLFKPGGVPVPPPPPRLRNSDAWCSTVGTRSGEGSSGGGGGGVGSRPGDTWTGN